MKRDRRLQGLTSDHHHGLVLARRILKGQLDAAAVRERFDSQLSPHFRAEEEVLLPALETAGELALVDRTRRDHAELRELLAAAERGEPGRLAEFADALERHIRFEERELFGAAEGRLAAEELERVRERAPHPAASRSGSSGGYVHGYSDRERARLLDQASTLTELLHADTRYPDGSTVLEAGCGVGAQTVTLARNSPGARITSIDVSPESLEAARARARAASLANVAFLRADIFDLPFPESTFDHVFVCFVLEHLAAPRDAVAALVSRLRPGGTLTLIEGDHGSTFFHPDDDDARRAIDCLVTLQARAGGDALIGRQLYPLLTRAGLRQVAVSPRMVYVDSSRPEWVEGFTLATFTAMVEGVREEAIASGLVDAETWRRGIAALRRAAGQDGVFCYTFFKGVGVR